MRPLRLFVKWHDLLILLFVVSLWLMSLSINEVAATEVDNTNENKLSREEQYNNVNKTNKIVDQM